MTQELKRYDIVLVDFGDNMDSEQSGIRPAIIIQNDIGNLYSTTTLVVPLTSQHKSLNQPTHTLIKRNKVNGLTVDSMVLGECIRQVSEKRIIKHIGSIVPISDKREIKRVYDANLDFGGM